MKDRYILEALQKGVIAAVAASSMPTLPIKAMMRNFTIPDNQKYLEIVQIPSADPRQNWNDGENKQGILRIVLHWPVNDEGAYAPLDVLASVASYFTKETTLQAGTVAVKIYQNSEMTGPIEGEKDNLFPASIFYRANII